MKKHILLPVLAGIAVSAISFSCIGETAPDNNLKVVIIRHGEKPENGDNLIVPGGEPLSATSSSSVPEIQQTRLYLRSFTGIG